LCPAGSPVEASDLAGPNSFFFEKIKERERDLFSRIFILKSEFFYVVKKYIPISYLEYPVFDAIAANIHIYQNLFSYVLHTTNTLTFFECLFYIQKILKVLKMCFHMDFLNTKKFVFLHFWILQHVCKTPKGIGQYSKKNTKILFWENSSIIHR